MLNPEVTWRGCRVWCRSGLEVLAAEGSRKCGVGGRQHHQEVSRDMLVDTELICQTDE